MIFVTGFARGGTSWLRSCIAFHPQVDSIPREMVVFRDSTTREQVESAVAEAVEANGLSNARFVNKAPANAPFAGKACRMFPEAKFVFIIRDPRDVFVSHKRGTKDWMRGSNSEVDGCMQKIRTYYEGYLGAADCRNLLLVRYEDLHQRFEPTMASVFEFLELPFDETLLNECYQANNFLTVAGRHVERRDSATRMGVIGGWAEHLSRSEADWYRKERFWSDFMAEHGYRWEAPGYRRILQAMSEAGVYGMDEEALLEAKLATDRPNVLLLHDIDLLADKGGIQSLLRTAEIENEFGYPGFFNFLPLDDPRYKGVCEKDIIRTIRDIRQVSPKAIIALHLNAAERFFPREMPEVSDDHPDMAKAVDYLHRQIDAYEKHGIRFRVASAHGYGRKKKKPNNRDSHLFTEELAKRGIQMYDTRLRPAVDSAATCVTAYNDVGGPLTVRRMAVPGDVDEAETYRRFPDGGLIRFLTHPGNYPIDRPLCLGTRMNAFRIGSTESGTGTSSETSAPGTS